MCFHRGYPSGLSPPGRLRIIRTDGRGFMLRYSKNLSVSPTAAVAGDTEHGQALASVNCKSVDCQDAGYLTTNLRRATGTPSGRGYLTTIFFRATTASPDTATTIYTPCGQADTSIEIVSLSPRFRTAMPSSPYISRKSHPGAATVCPS